MTIKTQLLFLISLFLVSCSKSLYPTKAPDQVVIYPAPPDTARIQFLKKISSSVDVTGDRKSFSKFIFGEEDNIPINKPYGITTSKGKILICDTYIHGIDIIDIENNTFKQFIPGGKGELKVPINCFVDKNGNLYVADSERKQIVVFDKDGKYRNSFGDPENFKPTDVFVQDDKVWVTNLEGHQINVYSGDSKNELLSKFPDPNSSEVGKLYSPVNLFVTDSKVYVSDFGDFKIKEYNSKGEFKKSLGSYGKRVGQFARPKGIAVDRDSNLYVVDAGFENVQIFNKDGKILMFFGGPYKGPGDMWLPAKVAIDYDNIRYFEKYVDPEYRLKYIIYVTNQFGPDKINIYGAIEPIKPGEKAIKQQRMKKIRTQGKAYWF